MSCSHCGMSCACGANDTIAELEARELGYIQSLRELESKHDALVEDMRTISQALDAYGVDYCRSIAKQHIEPPVGESDEYPDGALERLRADREDRLQAEIHDLKEQVARYKKAHTVHNLTESQDQSAFVFTARLQHVVKEFEDNFIDLACGCYDG